MIKAIIFDMVGPLLKKRPNYKFDEVIQIAEELSDRILDPYDFIHALKQNEITKNFSVQEIAERVTGKFCQVEEVWQELLPGLGQKYKLAVVNNGTSITIPYFKKQYPFSQFFEIFINSSEVKLEKPAPNIYHLACQKLQVSPQGCIFIDDTQQNVKGAEEVGMQGIVWKDFDSLKSKLISFGVL
ncbi:MAG: HAD-IA family hydrolase [Candidatus Doudnabacteria bacterium]|nr:HAD-IA family hydrolase [Candidatus Doudnabacteria bacterium]